MSLSCTDSDILSLIYLKNKKRNVILNAAFWGWFVVQYSLWSFCIPILKCLCSPVPKIRRKPKNIKMDHMTPSIRPLWGIHVVRTLVLNVRVKFEVPSFSQSNDRKDQ